MNIFYRDTSRCHRQVKGYTHSRRLIMLATASLCLSPMTAVKSVAQEVSPAISLSQVEDLRQHEHLGAAESSSIRPLNAPSVLLIKYYEGWRDTAYNDPSQYCTIGYGHLIALSPCQEVNLVEAHFSDRISADQGEKLLISDTATARRAIMKLVQVDLNDDQFGALTSLVFNIGKGNFERSTLLRVLNAGGVDAASREFRRWVSSGGKVLPGLVARRSCEAALFQSALTLKNGDLDSSACQTLGAASDFEPIDLEKGE